MNGIWDKYNPLSKGEYYLGQRPWFTVDRDRNIFFMMLGSDREEHCNRHKVLLWIEGYHVVAEIDLANGSSADLNNVPFKIVWDLVGVHLQIGTDISEKQIIELLKEALTVYGYLGIHKQVPNAIVKFMF